MFVLIISRPSSNIGHVGSKTRSPGQILENSCLHSRGQICNPILMKLCQNVCFDNIQAKFEYGSCRVKNQVTRSNLRKFLFTLLRQYLQPNFVETVRMFVLTISRTSLNMGHVGLKTRSPGQIVGNSCLHSKGHICDLILIKRCQNVCFDNFYAKFEYRSCWVKNQVTRLNLRKCLFTLQMPHLRPNFDDTFSDCLF